MKSDDAEVNKTIEFISDRNRIIMSCHLERENLETTGELQLSMRIRIKNLP